MEKDLKEIIWIGNSQKIIQSFPVQVKKDIGDALLDVQFGGIPPSAKHLKGLAPGVYEIRDNFNTDTYRTVFAIKLGDNVYVLHAFKKKSKRGIKTPVEEIKLIKSRYKEAIEIKKELEKI